MKVLRPKYHLPPTEQELAEIKQFWADFNALGNNINLLDPLDPAWMKEENFDDDGDDYGTEKTAFNG